MPEPPPIQAAASSSQEPTPTTTFTDRLYTALQDALLTPRASTSGPSLFPPAEKEADVDVSAPQEGTTSHESHLSTPWSAYSGHSGHSEMSDGHLHSHDGGSTMHSHSHDHGNGGQGVWTPDEHGHTHEHLEHAGGSSFAATGWMFFAGWFGGTGRDGR